ncbi:MAG: hypothetical protein ACXAB9_13980 [Candidatus Thorarchaeota archaeon]|jgi:hypothetical protein
MKANELIIDGVDFIGTFYHEVKEDLDKQMYIQHDDEWSEVEEFGYTKIACNWLGHYTAWVDYDKVKAVKIRDYRAETDDYQEYIYK